MDLTAWFSYQLKAGADGFIWAVEQMPLERRMVTPPKPLGEWNIARHVFHMLTYERDLVLPYMRHWLGSPAPTREELDQRFFSQDKEFEQQGSDLENMLDAFRRVRAEQIELMQQYDDALWQTTHATVWGEMSMQWIVSKTFQHTAEHTHDVMRMVLFWDGIEAREKARQAQAKAN